MTRSKRWIAALAACSAACAPALDWREFVPEGSGITVSFPCRPDHHARAVGVAGMPVQMDMLVCSAADTTFALSYFDVADPARIGTALQAWREIAVDNVRGREPHWEPVQVKGMTANEQALRLAVSGRLPDETAVQERAVFFVRGLRVYQATVIGAKPLPQAVDAFFGGLKFPA